MLKIEAFTDELGLSEEQLTKILEQQFAARKSAINTVSKIQVAELELRKLMQDKAADETKVKSIIKEIGEFKTELRLNRVEGSLAVHKVLTDEQFTKLESLKKDHFKNRMHRGPRQFHHQGHHRNFRGHRGGLGFGGFGSDYCEMYDEEIAESGSEI